MKLLNAAGLTGIRIPGSFQFGGSAIEPYRMFQQLKAKGQLTIRVNYLMRIFDYSSVEKMRETDRVMEREARRATNGWHGRDEDAGRRGSRGGHMRTAYEEPFRQGRESTRESRSCRLPIYVAAVRELKSPRRRVAAHAWATAAIDQCWTPTPQQNRDARSAAALVGRALLHRPAPTTIRTSSASSW